MECNTQYTLLAWKFKMKKVRDIRKKYETEKKISKLHAG